MVEFAIENPCYFLLNFVPPQLRSISPRNNKRPCYFLLNFVLSVTVVAVKDGVFYHILLFSFEFCEIASCAAAKVDECKVSCYFLLNFVIWDLQHLHGHITVRITSPPCYFLLNFVQNKEDML